MWDEGRHSTNECKETQKCSKQYLINNFKEYAQITTALNAQHATWQIDTVEKLLKRDETPAIIRERIKTHRPRPCHACNGKIHPQWNCPQTKKQTQLRRYKLSRNERKDNQVGDYACRKPFQLLKNTLIPQQVFDLYEKEFIPFYCD